MLLNFRHKSNFKRQELHVNNDKLIIEFYNELSATIHKDGEDMDGYTIVSFELDNKDRCVRNTVKY